MCSCRLSTIMAGLIRLQSIFCQPTELSFLSFIIALNWNTCIHFWIASTVVRSTCNLSFGFVYWTTSSSLYSPFWRSFHQPLSALDAINLLSTNRVLFWTETPQFLSGNHQSYLDKIAHSLFHVSSYPISSLFLNERYIF